MKIDQIRSFRRVLRQFTRLTSNQLRSCCSGVTLAQCLVLLEVDEQGPLTVGQLASRLGLDDSTLSRTIHGLVRSGLLDRTRSDLDRRVVRIDLTPEGAAVCKAIHEQNDALVRDVFARIPSGKRQTVVRNFQILVQALLDSEGSDGRRSICEGAKKQAR